MRTTITAITAALLLAGANAAGAGIERAGTTAANFLSVSTSARAFGMGGTALALDDGLASTVWNVGSLGFLARTELTLAHAGLGEGSSQEWAAFGGRAGSVLRWSVSGLYQSQGSFEERDASNGAGGSFDVSSMAMGGSLAARIGGRVALGVSGKWVTDNLGPYVKGSGLTFDAGAMMRTGIVTFGLAAQNVGGQMTYGADPYPFPTNFGFGVGVDHPASGLKAGLDYNVPNAYYQDVRAGVEWGWRGRTALRAGYRLELDAPADEPLTGPSFGGGAGISGLWLDYGYTIRGNGGSEHRIGLSLRPGALNLSAGDPFGQGNMRREYETPAQEAPRTTAPAPNGSSKKKS
jgi:hypothetical protein